MTMISKHVAGGLIRALDAVTDEVGLTRPERSLLAVTLVSTIAGGGTDEMVARIFEGFDNLPWATPELLSALAHAVAVYVTAAEAEEAAERVEVPLTGSERLERLRVRGEQELVLDEYDLEVAKAARARVQELQALIDAERTIAASATRRVTDRRLSRRAERRRVDALLDRERRAAEAVAA